MTSNNRMANRLCVAAFLSVAMGWAGSAYAEDSEAPGGEAAQAAPAQTRSAPPAEACFLKNMERSADCYTLDVPLDWSDPEGETIEIFTAVLPARQDSGKPPLVILAGGPGQAASDLGPLVRFAFERVRRERDILLMDQRGTGRSTSFNCPLDTSAENYEPFDAAIARRHFEECIERMAINVSHFQTEDAVRDLDHMRQLLGYDQLSLWGGSYGTRFALHYMKRFPEHVQSAVLDGVTPHNHSLFTTAPLYAQEALDRLIADCADDPDCSAQFPDFQGNIPEMIMADIRMPSANGLVTRSIPLDGHVIAEAVRGVLYTPDRSALLPYAMDALNRQADPSVIVALLTESLSAALATMSSGLTYAVLCSEDYRLTAPEAATDAAARSFHMDTFYRPFAAACPAFPIKSLPADYTDPVESDVPVLVLSGALDPITPPASAEVALETLSNATHIVAKGVSHGVTTAGCAPRLIAGFLEDPDAEIDAACLTETKRPPFVLTPSGPKP